MNVISPCRHHWHSALLLAILTCCLTNASTAFAQSADEVTIGYLYNFARFIEWPSGTFGDSAAPFTVGFIGRAALADSFAKNVADRKVGGRAVAIKRLERGDGAENCQIVFIGDPDQAASVLEALKGKPVLTVGEADNFLTLGGMIVFKKEGTRMVFDLNAQLLKSSRLTPDPKLEKAAHAVKSS